MNESYSTGAERDPQGWQVNQLDPQQVKLVDASDRRMQWDSVALGMTLQQKVPAPGSKIAIIGMEHAEVSSPHATFFEDINTTGVQNATEPNPAQAVAFPEVPTPEQVGAFLQHNREAGYMQAWSAAGNVPYIILSGDNPDAFEYGTMSVTEAQRSSAQRPFFS